VVIRLGDIFSVAAKSIKSCRFLGSVDQYVGEANLYNGFVQWPSFWSLKARSPVVLRGVIVPCCYEVFD